MKKILILSIVCFVVFALPANAENPKALYVADPGVDLSTYFLYNALIDEGFEVEQIEVIPENMEQYDLVIIHSNYAAHQISAEYMKSYIANGGGTVIFGGLPTHFTYFSGPHGPASQTTYNLAGISEWFGTPQYRNVGGYVHITEDNPLGSDLPIDEQIGGYCPGACAAVSNLHGDDTQILATWSNGYVAAFTHNYLDGRVFYYAASYHELLTVGALWAANIVNENNDKPIADANGPYNVNEGSWIFLDGSSSYDPDGTITLYEWDLDNDGQYDDASGVTHNAKFENDGTFTIGLKVTDNEGEVGFNVSTVIVNNVAPTVGAECFSNAVNEGDPVSFLGDFTDPGKLSETYTIEWDFGDGKTSTTGSLNPTHIYGDNGLYIVTLTVIDNDGGIGIDTTDILVNNVAPTVNYLWAPSPGDSLHFILPYENVGIYGSFIDAGWLDTHTATWKDEWGNEYSRPLTEEHEQPDSTGTTNIGWIFHEPGIYPISLVVEDDDGGIKNCTYYWTVLSGEEAIPVIDDYIQDLPYDTFEKNPDHRKNALSEKLDEVIMLIEAEEYQEAIKKLQNDIRAKADGYVDGNPKNDWIIDPDEQEELCMMIDDLTAYIETLL